MVNLEAGGGGGGGNEMQDLDMPEVPMPDQAPQQMEQPTAVDTSQAVGLANDYVRAAGGGGIGIGRGGGMGSGYGHGIGSGFGGFIGELRRKGLDVVLVIDGTGSMNLIIDDVKAKVRYDLEYLRTRSVMKDLRIMVQTPLVMFFKRSGH